MQNLSVWHSTLNLQEKSQTQWLRVLLWWLTQGCPSPTRGLLTAMVASKLSAKGRALLSGPVASGGWGRVKGKGDCACARWAAPGPPAPARTTLTCFTYWASSDASMWSKSPTVLKGRNKKGWKSLHPIKLAISQFCLRLAFSRKINQLLTKDLLYTECCCGIGGGSPKFPALIIPKL